MFPNADGRPFCRSSRDRWRFHGFGNWATPILDLLATCGPGDLVLCLVSGGGSALLELPPPGLSLVDLTTGLPGDFGPGKFAARVIEPIDVVDRQPVGAAKMIGTGAFFSGLPRRRVLLLNVTYRPALNLLTGVKQTAAAGGGTDGLVTTALPVYLPAAGEVAVKTSISLAPNPQGGYYVTIDAGATLIGVNNRDLRTFEVSLETCMNLAPRLPRNIMSMSEYGFSSARP